jgi:hypothetical protein
VENNIVRRVYFIIFFIIISYNIYGQWENGLILNVQEVDINKMKQANMNGAEAILKVIEQFVDKSYQFCFISENYVLTAEQVKGFDTGRGRFLVGLVGYPDNNNLLYAQVFFDKSFFIIIIAKRENDFKKVSSINLLKLNYDKYNKTRRDNVKEAIQRNNILRLGIER